MNILDYKKRFLDIFKEMKEDLGRCASVVIDHTKESAMTAGLPGSFTIA